MTNLRSMHSRRSVVTTATTTALAAGLTRSSARQAFAQSATPQASPAASPAASPVARGEWSFTDDKGVTVTLPAVPQRVVIDVNAAAPLWDFGIRPIAVFGWLANPEGNFGAAGGNIDPKQVEIIGNGENTIDVEALVALKPDLIVTLTFIPDDPADYWSLAADGPLEQVQQVAPIVAISGVQSASAGIARFAELAEALGADLASSDLVDAKAAWQDAERAFTDAVAAKPGISAIFVAAGTDMLYVANPERAGDVMYFRELGLTVPPITVDPANGDYWEYVSLESIGKFQTDMFMNSYRGLPMDEVKAMPTVAALPSVQAGQIYDWNQDFICSYQGMADILTALAANVEASEIITGD
ncbi:MAG: ABC transporter substrate-binding protein [Thermomicrobiales bacterium]